MDISLCGFYGKFNAGDDELQKNIIGFFNNLDCNIKIHKENDLDFHSVVVVGGGGLVVPKFFAFKNIGKLKDKKVILFNVNLTEEAAPLLPLFKKLNILFVVRDEWSVTYLKNNNFNNILYATDICFEAFKDLRKINNNKIMGINCNYYAFSKIFSNNYLDKLNAERSYSALQQFALWMMSFGWKIKLIPAQISKTIDDRVTNSFLHGLLNNQSELIYNNDITKNLSDVSLLISSRYHLSIFALSNHIPLLDINFHSKSKNLFYDSNLLECCLDFYDLTKEKLINSTINIENNKDYIKKINIYRVRNRDNWETVKQQIKQFIYHE